MRKADNIDLDDLGKQGAMDNEHRNFAGKQKGPAAPPQNQRRSASGHVQGKQKAPNMYRPAVNTGRTPVIIPQTTIIQADTMRYPNNEGAYTDPSYMAPNSAPAGGGSGGAAESDTKDEAAAESSGKSFNWGYAAIGLGAIAALYFLLSGKNKKK